VPAKREIREASGSALLALGLEGSCYRRRMARLSLVRALSPSSVTSLALCLLMAGCGDDAAGTTASGSTTGGEDETGRDETTTRTDTTTSADETQGVDTTGDACDCDEGQVCDPETGTCVDCLDQSHCDSGQYCDLDTHVCVTGCLDADDCDGGTPYCHEEGQVCVECLEESHCDDQLCHPESGSCVDCVADDDCDDADTPVCNPEGGTCVGCVADDDCDDADTPVCDTDEHVCVGCLDDSDCEGATPICDLDNTTCVGCLEDLDCDEAAPICDLDNTTCVECVEDLHCDDPTPACHDVGAICVECTNDDHCGLGYCCDQGANTCSACLPESVSIMATDSGSNRLILFNPTDGSVKDDDYFDLAGGTPFQAVQIDDEIWVSEQAGDRISRWSLTGDPLGHIGGQVDDGGLDNIRGIVRIGESVYVANFGTNNGAPGPAVVVFDLDGDYVSHFDISDHVAQPWGLLPFGGDLLVSAHAVGEGIHRFTLAGASEGTFHASADLNLAHQIAYDLNGNILAAGFNSSKILRIDATTGDVLDTYDAEQARGVHQLANGKIIWSRSNGAVEPPIQIVYVYDPDENEHTEVYTGPVRHFSLLQLP
jgi:hypothetical protein